MSTNISRDRCDVLVSRAGEMLVGQGGAALRGEDLSRLNILTDGAIAIDGRKIVGIGPSDELLARYDPQVHIDAGGNLVTPGLVDPHTHLIHAGSRHTEWEQMITGQTRLGLEQGIMSTVRRTRAAPWSALHDRAVEDLDEMLAHGTTTVEIKSGYGLDRDTELRVLDLVQRLRHPMDVVATYLGAHVLPQEYKADRDAFVQLVLDTLPDAAKNAEYCDVCCDPVGFTVGECRTIVAAAQELGMKIKVHGDQTGNAGGAQLAADVVATSVDHIDAIDEAGIQALAASETIGVILPGVTHHMLETTPSRGGQNALYRDRPDWLHHLISSGVTLALSTDYNPGSCYTLSMQTIMQIAARMYRVNYAAIWNMATINAAAAVGRQDLVGSLEVGKQADLVIWRVPEHGMVINRFGTNLAGVVLKNGKPVWQHQRSHQAADALV